jgi:hypothetical protein
MCDEGATACTSPARRRAILMQGESQGRVMEIDAADANGER